MRGSIGDFNINWMIRINIYENMDDMDDYGMLDEINFIDDLFDDSVVDVSPPTLIDIIDLTKESPNSARSSRSSQRNADEVSSSRDITHSPDRHRRPIPPMVLGNTKHPKEEGRVPRASSSNEVLTLDDTAEDDKNSYTVESDERVPVPLTCPICFESLSSNTKPITTRCGHLFCTECLKTYFRTSKKCPTCKATITLKSCTRLYL